MLIPCEATSAAGYVRIKPVTSNITIQFPKPEIDSSIDLKS